jgi:membrane protease YdiL (CAAX protease family)
MGENKKRLWILLLLLVIPPIIVLFMQRVFPPNYLISTSYKVVYLIPIFYRIFFYKKSFKKSIMEGFDSKRLKKNLQNLLKVGVILSLIYIGGYFLLRSKLDFTRITEQLSNLIAVDASNIIMIGAFIIVINSLLEEFFWRGFLFKEMDLLTNKTFAYLSTGIAFSFHHIAFIYTWFDPIVNSIAIIGLVGFALIMNFLFYKFKDLFSLWIIHIMVDLVQIVMGLKILGMI